MAGLKDASEVFGYVDEGDQVDAAAVCSRVYGLCFRRAGEHASYYHAGHYVGIALDGDVERRVWQHLTGKGSPLVAAAVAAGLEIILVLDVEGDRGTERRLHNRHATPHSSGRGKKARAGWCPLCTRPNVCGTITEKGS